MIESLEHYRHVAENAELLWPKTEVLDALDRMARNIAQDLSDKNPILLCVMTGGVVVMGHLATRLAFPLQMDYVHATRYRGATKGGELNWIAHPSMTLQGREVLLVDDIFDEGVTLKALAHYCVDQGVKSVESAVLVSKIHDRKVNYNPKYIGLEVPDRYVYGFGMDYKDYWRNAAGIYAVQGL